MVKKIYLVLFLFIFSLSFIYSSEAPKFTEAQNSAYASVIDDESATPELGLSDAEVVSLLKGKKSDGDNYNKFVSRIKLEDLQGALREDPSLVSLDNQAILNRLDLEIEKDPLWINKAWWGSNEDIKKNWLNTKGFKEQEGALGWGEIQIEEFKGGILTLKNGETKTAVDTVSVAEACGEFQDGPCLTLKADGTIRTAEGVDIKGVTTAVKYNNGALEYTITGLNGGKPSIDYGSFDPAKGKPSISVKNVQGVQVKDNRGFFGRERIIAEDTSLDLSSLGSGGVKIKATGEDKVSVYANYDGVNTERKFFELGKNEEVNFDYLNGVAEFNTGTAKTSVFDDNGATIFNTGFKKGDILTTQSSEGIGNYLKKDGTVIQVKQKIPNRNIIGLEDSYFSGPEVYAKPSLVKGDYLILEDFANGIDFESDVSAGGQITQKIIGTDIKIIHSKDHGDGVKGVKVKGLEIDKFRGTSTSKYGQGKKDQSRVIFDEGLIFGLGKDYVKRQTFEKTSGSSVGSNKGQANKNTYFWSDGQKWASANNEGGASVSVAEKPIVVNSINSAAKARLEGASKRVDRLISAENKKAKPNVDDMAQYINDLVATFGETATTIAQKKCTDKLVWDEKQNKCVPKPAQ